MEIGKEFALLWRFLGFFQRGALKVLHGMVAALIIIQILDGYGASISRAGVMGNGFFSRLASWWHIGAGSVLVVLGVGLAIASIKTRGFRGLFPYLWKDVTQLKKDISSFLKGQLPPPRPRGLAACVQGLGLGAILLAVLSGGLWLCLWLNNAPWQGCARWFHKEIVILVEIYAIGHGTMALLHFWMWRRNTQGKNKKK